MMKKKSLLLLILLSLFILFSMLKLLYEAAPMFMISLLIILMLSFTYMFTEQWITHAATEFENRFWTFIAFITVSVCLFCKDSPLRFSSEWPQLAWMTCILFTFLVHNYDRHLRRIDLSRIPRIPRIRSSSFGVEDKNSANKKINQLNVLLASLDHTWMSSTFLNIFFLPKVLYAEHSINAIFSEANKDELNLIISNIGLGHFFYKMKDHKYARIPSRTNLLTLLSEYRVKELNIPARAMLIDGLQRLKLSANLQCETFVMKIFESTKGDDLSELKSLTDAKGDINSLHKLLFVDIRSKEIKDAILKHIDRNAKVQAAHNLIGSRAGKQRGKFAWRKVLSDIDDTLYCSGGSWPAGIDQSYPSKAIYPGILAFYRELDLGITAGSNEWDANSRTGNLVFLSARPHVYKDVSEKESYKKFQTLQKERGLYTCPSLLAGSLDAGGQYIFKNDLGALAAKKFESFAEYLKLYPEYTCIFIGDNGQGDVRAAEMVKENTVTTKFLTRTYIHEVQPLHLTYTKSESTKKRKSKDFFYFKNYVEAAIDAFKEKLILLIGLQRIMQESVKDFEFIPMSSWMHGGDVINNNNTNYSNNTNNINNINKFENNNNSKQEAPISATTNLTFNLISPHKSLTTSTNRPSTSTSTSSSINVSSYMLDSGQHLFDNANATIIKVKKNYYDDNTVVSSFLSSPRLVAASTKLHFSSNLFANSVSSQHASTNNFYNYKKKKNFVSKAFSMQEIENVRGDIKRENRLRELNNSIEIGNEILKKNGCEVVKKIVFSCLFKIGSTVKTMFGVGIIENFRKNDGIYTICFYCEEEKEKKTKKDNEVEPRKAKLKMKVYMTSCSIFNDSNKQNHHLFYVH
jgi:hypothetical protein